MEANRTTRKVVVEVAPVTVTPGAERKPRAARYRHGDFVSRRCAAKAFRSDSAYGLLWDLIPEEGLTFEHLCRLSPWSEETTWLVLRRMDRVKKVIAVRWAG